MTAPVESNRTRLRAIAFRAMREEGLEPEFPPAAIAEIRRLRQTPRSEDESARDLRSFLWFSIDNDDSKDLDQLTVAVDGDGGTRRVLVAIADVTHLVQRGSAIDQHASTNTTTVYTPAAIFPMLPEELSTDLTSLGAGDDRLAVVVDLTIAGDGTLQGAEIYQALVRNHAKLAYDPVDRWLSGDGPLPPAASKVPGIDAQLRAHDEAAQLLNRARHEHGALDFATADVTLEFDGDALIGMSQARPNRAKALIENLMIAANGATARFLEARGFPLIRRVVRTPKRWDRVVQLAAETGDRLPVEPDVKALAAYLAARRRAAPERYADLSHTVIKLLGSGEYVVDHPGQPPAGHFSLAVRDYTHSTAPNRRYPDIITQRLVKDALTGGLPDYSLDDLTRIAAHCTKQEDAANKVERRMQKSAAALLVVSRIGERFDAVVTGASPKGTFVRVPALMVEGMLVRGQEGLDVADRVNVRLTNVDVERGFIDFER